MSPFETFTFKNVSSCLPTGFHFPLPSSHFPEYENKYRFKLGAHESAECGDGKESKLDR